MRPTVDVRRGVSETSPDVPGYELQRSQKVKKTHDLWFPTLILWSMMAICWNYLYHGHKQTSNLSGLSTLTNFSYSWLLYREVAVLAVHEIEIKSALTMRGLFATWRAIPLKSNDLSPPLRSSRWPFETLFLFFSFPVFVTSRILSGIRMSDSDIQWW